MPILAFLLMLAALADPRVAVTSSGPKPDSNVEYRFARAPWFMIYDPATGAWQSVDNSKAAGNPSGAGREAAKVLVDRGVKVVITGYCGTNAHRALSAAGIKIYEVSGGTVAQALRAYQAGQLSELK
jgi:predicted Fe-Mo cluster-binding NifX family protein